MELPETRQLRWILRRTAELLELGAEPVRGLVLPTSEFFPDRFDASPASVAALLARVQHHAGLSDLCAELAIVTPEGEAEVAGCSSGACGGGGAIGARLDRVARMPSGYAIAVGTGEVRHPVALTTALVRSVAFMFLSEVGAYDDTPPHEREPVTDLAAVLLGFGVLAANGSYIYMKGCGGVKVHSATRMTAPEIAVALAVFCRLHGVPDRTAAKHLETTPRELFGEACAWASSNEKVVRLLRSDPELVAADEFTLRETSSWLARALGLGRPKKEAVLPPSMEELAELERSLARGAHASSPPRDAARKKRLAELRELVEETLEGSRS